MNQRRMTVGQLYMAIGKEDQIVLSSMYDMSIRVTLSQEMIGYSAIMAFEISALIGHDGTYVALLDMPTAAIAALDPE